MPDAVSQPFVDPVADAAPATTTVGVLRDAQVSLLIDVRTSPRSRANPVFNIETLPGELEKVQIGYQY